MNFSTSSNNKEAEVTQGDSLRNRNKLLTKIPIYVYILRQSYFLQKHFPDSYLIFDGLVWKAMCHLPVAFWVG